MNHTSTAVAKRLEQLCIRLGDEASDDLGFVSIRALLAQFQIELIARPLLVEGMLATVDDADESGRSSKWVVLVDSEMHPISGEAISLETSAHPLSTRARNTIAHEMAHSLAFRPATFGLDFAGTTAKGKARGFVEAIERETERLSPLLLFPEKALQQFLKSNAESFSLAASVDLRARLGVSREVFVSRLQMLRTNDKRGLLERGSMRNLALGIAEWSQGTAVMRKWPLFLNFDRNVAPDFLHRLTQQERTRASDLAIPASSVLCGGSSELVAFECEARVRGASTPERRTVVLEVENNRREGQVLFQVRSTCVLQRQIT